MKRAILLLCLFAVAAPAAAQTTVVPLWPGAAPGSESWTQKEAVYGEPGNGHVRNVVKPSLTLYLPAAANATGTAVIIAPGGAFRWLAWEKEGTLVAEWLQKRGVAALVLKYRLTDTGTDEEFAKSAGRGAGASLPAAQIQTIAVADGRQAIKVARQHAAEWKIDPTKIGVMGFSAGGYVAVMMALDHDASTRPDFSGAIYACCVTTPLPPLPTDVAPLFIASAANDPISSTAGPALFSAWTAAKKSAEIHIYAAGGHGFGMSKLNLPSDTWIDRFGEWLRAQSLIK